MAKLRWAPILGVFIAMALVPGALAHHCIPDEDSPQGGGFNTQSTAAPPASPLVVVGAALIPLVAIGATFAATRGPTTTTTTTAVAAPSRGKWVCTPTAWVWVPEK